LKEIHIDLSDDGTDTLDVSDMVLVVPEFPDTISTRTDIVNTYVRNKKAQYEHAVMNIKLCVGVTNVPCQITGTKFDFTRRSFPKIHRDGHLNLTVTGMDVGITISVSIPTPDLDVIELGKFTEENIIQRVPEAEVHVHVVEGKEKEKRSPQVATKEVKVKVTKENQSPKVATKEAKVKSTTTTETKKEVKEAKEAEGIFPTISCHDAQTFTLHGFSLEFQEDVKNAELLNSFTSHFEREICFGVSRLVAGQLAEIMKDACIHMTNMVRLSALQTLRLNELIKKKKVQ